MSCTKLAAGMAKRKLGPDAVQPMRGGVHIKRAHDLSPRSAASPTAATNIDIESKTTAESALPSLYAHWLKDVLPGAIPSEPHATCDDCAMWTPTGSGTGPKDQLYFGTETKCCTLIPILPNFLAGRILRDTDPHPAAVHGRGTVEARIRSRAAVTPLGLGRTLGFSLHYRHHEERFGQSVALRCPHYVEEGGLCGVWRHRESTCATWFCKHARGFVAVRFWSGLQRFLGAIEHELAFWCTKQLGLDNEETRRAHASGALSLSTFRGTFASHLVEGQLDTQKLSRHPLGARREDQHAAFWGSWVGRERELYIEAAKLVDALSWSELAALLGSWVEPAVAELRARYAALLSEALPARLSARNDELELVQIGKRHLRVDAYRAHDPVKVPRELIGALVRFDGAATTAEVLSKIAREDALELEPALIRKLVDFGLLVER